MNYFELIILSLALSMNVFQVAVSAAIKNCTNIPDVIKISFLLGLFKGGLLALGFWIGTSISHMIWDSRFYIVFGIFLILGIKMIFESIKISPANRSFQLDNTRILILTSLAVNIDGFIAGLAFAFSSVKLGELFLIITALTILVTMAGLFFGRRRGNLYLGSKVELTGGLILLGYSLFLLLEKTGI